MKKLVTKFKFVQVEFKFIFFKYFSKPLTDRYHFE